MEQEADFGEPNIVVDLIPNGGQVEVTTDNRQQYVDAYVQHLLIKSISRQNKAFCKGFRKVSQRLGNALSFMRRMTTCVCLECES